MFQGLRSISGFTGYICTSGDSDTAIETVIGQVMSPGYRANSLNMCGGEPVLVQLVFARAITILISGWYLFIIIQPLVERSFIFDC